MLREEATRKEQAVMQLRAGEIHLLPNSGGNITFNLPCLLCQIGSFSFSLSYFWEVEEVTQIQYGLLKQDLFGFFFFFFWTSFSKDCNSKRKFENKNLVCPEYYCPKCELIFGTHLKQKMSVCLALVRGEQTRALIALGSIPKCECTARECPGRFLSLIITSL